MAHCTLCGLETPTPPITRADVEGTYCCRGCLEVARTVDDAAAVNPDAARDALASNDDGTADAESTGEVAYFAVDGMHCATCEVFLESQARGLAGVSDASASYAGDALKVTYDPTECAATELPTALSGYGYRVRDTETEPTGTDGGLSTGARLLVGGFFAMMVMVWYVLFLYPIYLGRGPIVPFFDPTAYAGRYLLWNVAVLAGAATAIAGYPIFRGALVSLRAGRPNMDLLVALAASAAFTYSLAVLVTGGVEVYFDVAVVVVLAVTAGDHWESRMKARAASGLAARATARVETARVRTRDGPVERPVETVEPGTEVVVATGDRVPLDGTVVSGDGAVDDALLTGESAPREVAVGDDVIGGSVLVAGGIDVAVSDAAESTLDRVVAAMWDAQSTHGGVQRLADSLAAVFVPGVFALALVAFVGHLLVNAPLHAAVLTALSVLVVSCPCALGLATPLAVSTGISAALDRGVVVTDATVFERAPSVDTVVFDKTGTLTTGEMTVTDVVGDEAALTVAAALETYADHPVARAVCAYAEPGSRRVSGVERHAAGLSGRVDGDRVLIGRPELFDEQGWTLPDDLRARAEAGVRDGRLPVVVGLDGVARAVALAGDDTRPEWESVLTALAADHRIVVLTGDDDAAASRFRDHPAVDTVFAGVPPEGKTAVVASLRERGAVAMVGDGTNDAPALATADLGVALADGTALAVDAADAVITTGDLTALPALFAVATATRRRVRENLAWALCYNAVAVPLAVLGLLNPLFAAVAMATSSLLVVANSVRGVDAADATEGVITE